MRGMSGESYSSEATVSDTAISLEDEVKRLLAEIEDLKRVNAEQTEELKHLKEWIEHLNKNPD